MNKLDASALTILGQSFLDILIKVGVGAVLLLLNYLSAGLSNGSLQLPYPVISLPLLTLLVSQFDSFFVNWTTAHNITPTV